MLNKYENYSLTIGSTCRSQFKCDAKYCINKLEHCGIKRKANYLYNDVKGLTPKCFGKCHCVVKGKLDLIICFSHLENAFNLVTSIKRSFLF